MTTIHDALTAKMRAQLEAAERLVACARDALAVCLDRCGLGALAPAALTCVNSSDALGMHEFIAAVEGASAGQTDDRRRLLQQARRCAENLWLATSEIESLRSNIDSSNALTITLELMGQKTDRHPISNAEIGLDRVRRHAWQAIRLSDPGATG